GNLGSHEATIDRNRDHCSRDRLRLEQTFRRMGGPDDRQSQPFIGRAWGRLTKKSGFLREALLSRPSLGVHRQRWSKSRELVQPQGCARARHSGKARGSSSHLLAPEAVYGDGFVVARFFATELNSVRAPWLGVARAPYSVTSSTCLSMTCPVNRSIATCAQ